ncbi:hypothetical protein DPX16_10836 [Anabarilius grahami]|uniref:Uncharacterized protein n=1 Tax=Anabarilius grahami TaxID=495550 RepID=A0A3N0Z7U8_ANAGA|nr:hypothetical protein DPX16_10836 [Anabarilius grahami]
MRPRVRVGYNADPNSAGVFIAPAHADLYSSQCSSAVSMHSQLPFMCWSSSITLKAMPAFLAEVKCLKHKCRHIPGTSVLRDLFLLPAAGGSGGEWQLCKACGRQCSSSLCVEYYSPSEVLLCGRLL